MTEQEEFEFRLRRERERAAAGTAPGYIASLGASLGNGVGQTALGLQHYVGKGMQSIGAQTAGDWLVNDAAQGRQKLDAENAPYKAANPMTSGAGQIVGEILATLPVGGALAAPVKAAARALPAAAPVLSPLAEAIASSGMNAGGATGKAAFAARVAGGAATGGASAALVNPGDGGTGAAVGAAMPVVGKLASAVGEAAAGAVRPFFKSGQERIAGQALRGFATDADAAAGQLRSAREIIPGSAPTAAMAAGDPGLAGLGRTLQSVSPEYGAELALRQAAANGARSAALEAVAATPGKLAAAQAARDAVTDPMREAVLSAAGKLDASGIAAKIERMMADPNNAGATTRAGLQRALGQIREIAGDTGLIDARALYEIRKDIGLAMNGKLQGEAGNLRYARGALDRVQSLFDDAIDSAASRMPTTGTAVAMPGANISAMGAAGATGGARPSWRGYLQEYAKQSVPINQMEALADVLKRVQTGTVDANGVPLLSAANLNNLIKNEGADLLKKLSPDQIDLLRRLRADLNAQQIATNIGRPPGSDTVRNLASTGALSGLMGGRLASSQPVQNTIGRGIDLLFKKADARVVQTLNDAMLHPEKAAQLMEAAGAPSAIAALFARTGAQAIPYRAAPVLSAQ
ncbi:MAG: hypothetical protein ACKOXG_10345 [Arenimonas sp.]